MVVWTADPGLSWPGVTTRPCPAPVFSLEEQWFWARELRRVKLAAFHAPHLNVPLACPVPLVVTLHDLIPLRFPGTIAHPLGQVYFGVMARWAARRAARVIVPSAATAAGVARLGVGPERLRVVPQGVDPAFAAGTGASPVAGRYVLYCGQQKRYKNLETLVAAFAALGPASADVRLVLAGKPDPRAGTLDAAIARHGLADRVVRPGYLDDATLAALYRGAVAYAFPSRCEGFGLPPLEAMAAGVPVVASEAVREVVGGAALVVGPDDVAGWTTALARVLGEPGLREQLVAAGRARVAAFPWEATARLTAAVYAEVAM